MSNLSAFDRFWPKVDKTGDCWQWLAGCNSEGYGGFWDQGATHPAYRWLYMQINGPLTSDQFLDHLCKNRRCVNPDHLEVVTNGENVKRGDCPSSENRRKTHCAHGHEFTVENTRVRPCGRRACRACARSHSDLPRSA